MIPHIGRHGLFVVHHSAERLAVGAESLEDRVRSRLEHLARSLRPELRQLILHVTVLGIAIIVVAVARISS